MVALVVPALWCIGETGSRCERQGPVPIDRLHCGQHDVVHGARRYIFERVAGNDGPECLILRRMPEIRRCVGAVLDDGVDVRFTGAAAERKNYCKSWTGDPSHLFNIA